MSYQVPQHIDPNKVFLINHSELEGRLDSMFYTRQFSDIIVALKKCFLYKRLGQVALFSSESWNQKDYYETVFPYIEIGAINITDGKIDDVSFVPVEQAPSRAKVIVRTGDIIISTTRPDRGAIIKITENENLYIASTGFSVIRNIDSNINPDYLLAILRHKLILLQMRQRSTGGNYPAITQEELSKIIIPIPPVDIQNKIVSLIESAHTKKQEADFVANSLVQSIDEYLLSELGIQLPETKSQTIQDRMFVVNFSELSGDRLDVEYNNPHKHGAISKVLKNAKYPTALLSFLAKDIFQGVGKDETEDSAYVLLKVKNILRGNMIDYSDVEFVKSVPQNKLLLRNDIISPFIGEAVRQVKFSIFNNEEHKYTVDNNTGVIRLKESVNAQYVCEYLCSCLGKMQIERLIGGGGVPFLGSSGAKKLNIVVPPLPKQQEIVDHISAIRQQAKALQEEGKAILEQAKKEVEHMILG